MYLDLALEREENKARDERRCHEIFPAGHATMFQLRDNDNVKCNFASGTRKNSKNIKVSASRWSNHNEYYIYSNNAITNNCVAGKHGNIVAAVLSRAQLEL